jgi:hypothetical protein
MGAVNPTFPYSHAHAYVSSHWADNTWDNECRGILKPPNVVGTPTYWSDMAYHLSPCSLLISGMASADGDDVGIQRDEMPLRYKYRALPKYCESDQNS